MFICSRDWTEGSAARELVEAVVVTDMIGDLGSCGRRGSSGGDLGSRPKSSATVYM
jgi:hypothetical protein